MGKYLYAGFWKRLGAYVIDMIVLVLLTMVVFIAAQIDAETLDETTEALEALFLPVAWLYYAVMESSTVQASLGKMAFEIRVTDLNGNRLSFWRATGRFWGKLVSGLIFGFGFFMTAFTAKKQALHDVMAGCLVVNKGFTSHKELEELNRNAAERHGVKKFQDAPGPLVIGEITGEGLPEQFCYNEASSNQMKQTQKGVKSSESHVNPALLYWMPTTPTHFLLISVSFVLIITLIVLNVVTEHYNQSVVTQKPAEDLDNFALQMEISARSNLPENVYEGHFVMYCAQALRMRQQITPGFVIDHGV